MSCPAFSNDARRASVSRNNRALLDIKPKPRAMRSFHEQPHLGKEAECRTSADAVAALPLSTADDSFAVEISNDLVAQGYGGNKLIKKFDERRNNMQKAIGALYS
jgi:hypothetical protein